MKHTKGPWEYCGGDNANVEVNIGEVTICIGRETKFSDLYIIDRNEMEANGKLIAAAPDLLEALNQLLSLAEDGYKHHRENCSHEEFLKDDRTALYEAREAIKKATL